MMGHSSRVHVLRLFVNRGCSLHSYPRLPERRPHCGLFGGMIADNHYIFCRKTDMIQSGAIGHGYDAFAQEGWSGTMAKPTPPFIVCRYFRKDWCSTRRPTRFNMARLCHDGYKRVFLSLYYRSLTMRTCNQLKIVLSLKPKNYEDESILIARCRACLAGSQCRNKGHRVGQQHHPKRETAGESASYRIGKKIKLCDRPCHKEK